MARRGRRRHGVGVAHNPLGYTRMGTLGRPQAEAHPNPFEGPSRCSPQPGGDGHFPWGILACPPQFFLRPTPPVPLLGDDPLRPTFCMLLPQLTARPLPSLAVEPGQKFLPKGFATQAPTTPKGKPATPPALPPNAVLPSAPERLPDSGPNLPAAQAPPKAAPPQATLAEAPGWPRTKADKDRQPILLPPPGAWPGAVMCKEPGLQRLNRWPLLCPGLSLPSTLPPHL